MGTFFSRWKGKQSFKTLVNNVELITLAEPTGVENDAQLNIFENSTLVDDGDEHFAGAMDLEGFLNEKPFAVMVVALELDLSRESVGSTLNNRHLT